MPSFIPSCLNHCWGTTTDKHTQRHAANPGGNLLPSWVHLLLCCVLSSSAIVTRSICFHSFVVEISCRLWFCSSRRLDLFALTDVLKQCQERETETREKHRSSRAVEEVFETLKKFPQSENAATGLRFGFLFLVHILNQQINDEILWRNVFRAKILFFKYISWNLFLFLGYFRVNYKLINWKKICWHSNKSNHETHLYCCWCF